MLRRALFAAALAALALPAAAPAATISKDGATLRFEATPTIRDLLRIGLTDASANVFFDIDTVEVGEIITPVAPCVSATGGVKCPAAGISRIVVNLGDDDDVLSAPFVPSVETAIPMTIDGGIGGDSLRGGGGADIVSGGDGGDSLNLTAGADDLSGGSSFDTVSTFVLNAVTVSLNDIGDDGQAGGAQGANVHSDIENLRGTNGNDVLIGSNAANEIDGFDGNDRLVGEGGLDFFTLGLGNDTVEMRDGLGERVLCGDGDDTAIADDIDALGDACEHVNASGELVRDLDHDGISKPEDCNDADPAIRPGAADALNDGIDQDCDGADAIDRDRDRDGVAIPFDCDDGNARAAPGKREIYGNKVDEDCNGRADPLQTITTPVRARFIAAPGGARIVRLQVLGATKGTRVQVRCKRSGCPFKRRTLRLKRTTRKLDLRERYGLRRIASQTIEIRLLRSDSIGRVVRFVGNGGGIPSTRILCLTPGKKKPRRC